MGSIVTHSGSSGTEYAAPKLHSHLKVLPMKHQQPWRNSSAPRTGRRHVLAQARILAAILLTACFCLAGGPAHADIIDPFGHQFHSSLMCDPASFSRGTHLYAWRLDNKPSSVVLTLRNIKTGAVLTSDPAGVPAENIPGNVEWAWIWIRPGDEAVYGPNEAWVHYTWPDGSMAWEQLTDISVSMLGNGAPYCILGF